MAWGQIPASCIWRPNPGPLAVYLSFEANGPQIAHLSAPKSGKKGAYDQHNQT